MTFQELAEAYCDLNVFNVDTRETIIRIGRLFDKRTTESVETYSLTSVGTFKRQTLKVAKNITYNGYLRYLRIIADFGVEIGACSENYFRTVKTAPIPKAPAKTIPDTDLWIAVSYLHNHPKEFLESWFWLGIIKLLYYTGIRRRQVINLRIRDIDFDNNTIALRSQGSKTLREWFIPMHPHLKESIRDVIERSQKVVMEPLTEESYVFNLCRFSSKISTNPHNDEQMNPNSITQFFKKLSKRSGVKIGAHRFRHTVATKLCNPEEGEPDVFAVQEILGHKMISTTRSYVSMSQHRLQKTLDKINMPNLLENVLTHYK